MPTPNFVQLPAPANTTGLKVDVNELTVAATTVERQNISLADPTTAAGIAGVTQLNADAQAATIYGVQAQALMEIFNGATVDRARAAVGHPVGTQAVGIAGAVFSDLARNLAAAATTTVELTTAAGELANFHYLNVEFDTAAGTGTTPTLDVYIQVSADGTNWNDRIHFTQATTGALKQEAGINSAVALGVTTFADGTLAAATVVSGPFPGRLRIKYVVAGTTPVYNPVNVRVTAK